MKPSDYAKKALKQLESLETEKITKIHEIWKIESMIQTLKNSLDAIGCRAVSERLERSAEKLEADFENLMNFTEKNYGRNPCETGPDDNG